MAQHYSFRVPWHDNGWNGSICNNPTDNHSCMRLKGINQNRVESIENKYSACAMCDLDCINNVPCIREGACFMSENIETITLVHPYASWSPYHKHLEKMQESFLPYTYPARPFRWVMRERRISTKEVKTIEELAQEKGFEYHSIYEPDMDRKTWVQDGRNQKASFDCFFRDAEENRSLCVFYAKQVPFTEDSRRVVIGIGHIQKVFEPKQYEMKESGKMTSFAWENMVQHSIRKDMKDGFLLPYYDLMKYAADHPNFDVNTGVVFASEDYFEEFSYAAEQLSYDAIIDVILQCIDAVELYKQLRFEGDWDNVLSWLNDQLSYVWKDRGPFPGLGAVLTAFGIPAGCVIAKGIKDAFPDDADVWKHINTVFDNPSKYLSPLLASQINKTIRDAWNHLPLARKNYIKLLSRVSLTTDQAKAVFNETNRSRAGINNYDEGEVIKNPYLLYEKTRERAEHIRIPIKKVDLAFFPVEYITDVCPIELPSAMDSDIDKRRVRALLISELEKAADQGHTLMPMIQMIRSIQDLVIEPKCNITDDIIVSMNDFFSQEIEIKQDVQGKDYYKLFRYTDIDKLIYKKVTKRFESTNRNVVNVDWVKRVNEECDKFPQNPDTDKERRARQEKAAALKVLAEARISVLIGGAGTGKTTVLEILCKEPQIYNDGILLLAPTGKARVRMSQGLLGKVDFKACTIAQFLAENKRYDFDTRRYHILPKENTRVRIPMKALKGGPIGPQTIIVDESSMLTEDMLGALLDAIQTSKRIIFVGDNNQLPPIGAGRPFVDIIQYLLDNDTIADFPEVGSSYAKLNETNRQLPDKITQRVRSDVRLSRWFCRDCDDKDDGIFAEIQAGAEDGKVIFKRWTTKEDLEALLQNAIVEATGMKDVNDVAGFCKSLGGNPQTSGMEFFNDSIGKADKSDCCVSKVEDWQVLCPVRNDSHGVLNINHMIHEKYRRFMLDYISNPNNRYKLADRMGSGEIILGDKVIHLRNEKSRYAYPQGNYYLANGEIGTVVTKWSLEPDKKQRKIEVEFASQPGHKFTYDKDDFGDDGSEPLELAYALTVHKSQGSQFATVILVMSDKCFLMSRELLYTALTRQKDKLIILYDEEAYNLKKYSSDEYSEIARRYTDLFETPDIVEIGNKYFEEKRIHRTKDGTMVRSKSEVIIYNMLLDNGVVPYYEEKLVLGDTYKLPDFTIIDEDSGETIIWEHLGMMGNPEYRRRWEEKKALYAEYGITEENGNLIVTQDSLEGAIDSEAIQRIIDGLN